MYLKHLVCPRKKSALITESDSLVSAEGRRYPVIAGIPVLLLDDVPQTMELAQKSIAYSRGMIKDEVPHLYIESIGLSDEEKRGIMRLSKQGGNKIDPAVSYLVGATNGIAYKALIGNLKTYPIPEIPLPPSKGSNLLDIGCNWGRWCIAAARKGYSPVGIDPSLGAVSAGRRACKTLGVNVDFVCGDGRFLPFRNESFDVVFSYSVLQHMDRSDVARVIREIQRVLKPGGTALIQMPNALGIRCLYHQARRGFRQAKGFEVRYWTLKSLKELFNSNIGNTHFFVDCFFGLGLQKTDVGLTPGLGCAAIQCSEFLKTISTKAGGLICFADSVYVNSIKPSG